MTLVIIDPGRLGSGHPMSWITAIWSSTTAVCLMLAGVHFLVWLKSKDSLANLLFSISSTATAVCAGFELRMMHAATPGEFGELLRWYHVPLAALVVSLIWFVYRYLRSGRLWMVWLFCGLRLITLILTFTLDPNLNFLEITGLREIPAWGETIVTPIGVKNPLTNITNVSGLLLLAFVVDATITAWRRGSRRRALVVGFTFAIAIVLGVVVSELMNRGGAPVPVSLSICFMIIALGMAYELSSEILTANRLAGRLLENEERLRLTTEAARVGVWEWDVGRDEIWVTDTIRSRVGLDEGERPGLERFLESLHPDDREKTHHCLQEALSEGSEWQAEYRSINTAGDPRWIAARGQVERASDGRPLRVRGVSLDITERKLAEQTVRQAAEFNQQVLASLDHQIAILDRVGTIIEVNEAWERFARENGNMAGSKGANYLDVCRATKCSGNFTVPEIVEGIRSVLEGGKPSFEMECVCPAAGKDVFLLVRVVPLRSPGGGAVVSHLDLTPLRAAELEAQSLRRDLTHASRVSTLGQLSSALAHELNQPLGAILSNAEAAEMMLEEETPDLNHIREILADIRRDDERAAEVIRRMRAFLRKRNLEIQRLDVNELVRSVLEFVKADASLRGTVIHPELFAEPLPGRGDRVHLQQVLLNLLVNAMDATAGLPPSERRISVRTALNDAGEIEVAVSDNGPGIPPDQLSNLFDSFFTTKPEGLGMGISIARTIVQAHHGRIWAENHPAGGATFRFTLPEAADQESHEQPHPR